MHPFLESIFRDASDRVRRNATLNPFNKGSEHVMSRRSKRRRRESVLPDVDCAYTPDTVV